MGQRLFDKCCQYSVMSGQEWQTPDDAKSLERTCFSELGHDVWTTKLGENQEL